MEAKTVALVQDSFKLFIPIADQGVKIFYDKLFEINPSLTALFPSDPEKMGAQRKKLTGMLVAAVNGLNDLNALVPVLQDLGKRHVSYKVEPAHYDNVGEALLTALEIGLGDAFTPEVKSAWAEVYGVMANTMIEASKEVSPVS